MSLSLYSSDNTILINKTDDCNFDIKTNIEFPELSIVKGNTNTVTLTGTATQTSPLKANVVVSTQAGNTLSINSDGLYVPTFQTPAIDYQSLVYNAGNGNLSISNGNTINIPLPQLLFDCGTKILQLTGSTPVNLSCLSQSFVETSLSVVDTPSIDFITSGTSNHTLTGNVKIDGTQTNALSINANGLFVSPQASFSETPLVANDSSTVDFSTSGTSNHTLTAGVKISTTSNNSLIANSDGLYVPVPTSTSYTFQNGLNQNSGIVELGGTLLHGSLINTGDNSLTMLTGGNAGSFTVNDSSNSSAYASFKNSTDNRYITILSTLSKPLYQGTSTSLTGITSSCSINNTTAFSHNSTNTVNAGLYGEFGINTGANTLTLSTGTPKSYSGVVGVFTIYSSGAITGGMPSGGTFYSNLGGATTLQNAASLRTFGVVQTPGTSTYTGTINNYYGLYLEPLDSTGSISANITNKYGIYQAGTNDINRFFGAVQNAGGTTQFSSDIRVKENITDFKRGLAEIDEIKTHNFNYTYNQGKQVTGIIAQELETIIPEAVSKSNFETPNGIEFSDFRMVDQTVLFYTMLNAIKELSSKLKIIDLKLKNE